MGTIDFEKYLKTTRSGARVAASPECPYVLKYAPPERADVIKRLIEQARYMTLLHHTTVFPDVHMIFEYGYIMEQLNEIPSKMADEIACVLVSKAQRLLSTFLWGDQVKVLGAKVLGKEHELYMLERAIQYGGTLARDRMQAALGRVRKSSITRVDFVHGDPTIDNMMNLGTRLVLPDPIPASDRMPAVAAHDLGKLLQSAWGYEIVNSAPFDIDIVREDRDHLVRLTLAGWDDDDKYAAQYFLAVHILRLIPYQPVNKRNTFIRMLNEIPL